MDSSYANAVLITVDDDLVGLTYIGIGQNNHIDGNFDINNALSSSIYNKQYSIDSAFISLKFVDDSADPTFYDKTYTGQQMWNPNTWNGEGSWYFDAWDTLLIVIYIN